MPPTRIRPELQQNKAKLTSSYNELLQEFSSKDLRHVGNYTLGKLIGKGSFGRVYAARHNLTNGTKVVLKSSKKDDANLAREIHHHRQFLHPHIVRLYEVIVTENLVWLVLEHCPGDELYNYLLKNGPLPPEKVQKIFAQLVGAVSYVHNKSCVHRDLKLENILLDRNENVKLCDFGFTREYEGKASYLQTFCGTVCYSAPEMLKGEKYAGEKVDVWSLGIILYALLTGELPFDEDDDQATKQSILKNEPKFPDSFPAEAKTLASKLLSKRPLYRPILAEVLAHTFLAEHAPQQQAVLNVAQPAPFTTPLEKTTLERMRSAGVDIDQVIENVLSQRCDVLAGWWALLIEKEEHKEVKREQKRKEREAEMKSLRRVSGASSRLERLAPTLAEVSEEGPAADEQARVRGRRERRSTPQIVIPDLPQLPEGSAIESPRSATPPVPIEKDSVRSPSTSRPPPPPKDFRRRSSHLQLVTTNPDLLHPNGIAKRRFSRRHPHSFMNQLASLKHWLVESAKRAKSPGKATTDLGKGSPGLKVTPGSRQSSTTPTQSQNRPTLAQVDNRSSMGRSLTPTSSFILTNATSQRITSVHQSPRQVNTSHRHRNSLSPSPLTPRSSTYRRGSIGLRGRKSTSSSVSSIRSIHHRHSHSKASSTSSKNSLDTTSTPTTRSAARSPHSSIKVLPGTPQATTPLPPNIRLVRQPGKVEALKPSPAFNEVPAAPVSPGAGVVFARRKKSPFRGPTINTTLQSFPTSNGQGTPGLHHEDSGPTLNVTSLTGSRGNRRKSTVIEEEEEEKSDEIEEVDHFSPVVMGRGESLHTITMWDDAATPAGEGTTNEDVAAVEIPAETSQSAHEATTEA